MVVVDRDQSPRESARAVYLPRFRRAILDLPCFRSPLQYTGESLKRFYASLAWFVLGALAATAAHAELSSEELAKLAQNPVANLISVPFQDNVNLNYGPLKKTQNILNIQPVIPFELSKDWNLITRTIVPVISQPPLFAGDNRTNGIGATQFSAFLSPSNAEGTI